MLDPDLSIAMATRLKQNGVLAAEKQSFAAFCVLTAGCTC